MPARFLSIFLACLLLVGCLHKPLASVGSVSASETAPIQGQIGTMKGYHVQLTDLLNDFAKGATVSLIEVSSGETKGTSLATATGEFVIRFGRSFVPARANPADARSVAYYLEAIKGIKGPNAVPNQAGADSMRLRTITWYDFNARGWVGLGNATAGDLKISLSTTAVAFYINQKRVNNQAVSPEAYIGSIDPTRSGSAPSDYTESGDLTATVYGNLFTQVTNAVSKDQDPIHALVLSPDGTAVNTQTDFAISGLSPNNGIIGTTVTISGLNFDPARMEVAFVGAVATVNQGASSRTALVVTVPPGARSGLIRVSVDGVNSYSQPFTVTTQDGHRATFTDASGNVTLYAVSNSLGTLVRVNPDGSTTTLSTAMSAPRSVLVNPEGVASGNYSIYVADAGTGRIVKANNQGAVLDANFLAVSEPNGLALGPDGDLYVAQTGSNQILRARVNWGAGTVTNPAVATYTGLSGPTALAFDYSGNLYVVETGQGRIRRFSPQAADAGILSPTLTDWAYLNDPQGIAIDTSGNCFVTSQANNAVFRIDPARNVSAFAAVSGARAIARDPAGNLYVSDQTRNLIRRITLTGDQRIYAYGLASLRGIAVDGSNNVYAALHSSGAILKLSSDGVTTAPLISGIAPPSGLTLRNTRIYVAHTETHNVTEVTLTGAARSVITSGLHSPGGVEVSDDGTTYYAGRLNLGDSWWLVVPTGGEPYDNSGLDISSSEAITQRRALIHGTYEWDSYAQALWKLDASTFIVADRGKRKLVLMSALPGGAGSQAIRDVTPTFGAARVFPNDIYDLVYDGTRYLYVSCLDRNIYRIDTLSYGAAPGTIAGMTGTPYGMTIMGGTLYVVDRTNNRINRVSSPQTASSIDAWTASFASTGLLGLTNFGGFLYASDYEGRRIWKIDPTGPSASVYVSGLNGVPTRLHPFNDGRLLVRVGDGVYYTISTATPPGISQYTSTIGCTGCGIIEFFIDGANNVYWSQPRQHNTANAYGMLNTRELARDGSWLYVAATHGVYGINFSTNEDLSVSGVGTPYGLAVNPTSRDLYVLNSGGTLYTVDATNRTVTNRLSLPSSGWGLDYNATANAIYAACSGNGFVYRIDPTTWSQTPMKMGLHAPMF